MQAFRSFEAYQQPLLTPEVGGIDLNEGKLVSAPELCDVSNPVVQSRELLLQPTQRQSRHRRSSEIVETSEKDFKLSEIWDIDDNLVGEVVASIPKDERLSHYLSLLEYLHGWKIETRQRRTGAYDKYYHHHRSRKTLSIAC